MNTAREIVELHIVSDSTGETAARLVAALEAQFPEQPFEEVRHPQIETLDDLQLAVSRAKGRPAVMVYTLVDRETARVDALALPQRAASTTATCSATRSSRSRRCRAWPRR